MLTGTKSKKSSLTLWGGALAVFAPLGALLGYNVTDGDTSELINSIALAASGLGGVVAVIGRVRATKQVR